MEGVVVENAWDSKFRLVVLTAQRARQLREGARPRVATDSLTPQRIAMLEVRAGLVSWSLEGADAIPAENEA